MGDVLITDINKWTPVIEWDETQKLWLAFVVRGSKYKVLGSAPDTLEFRAEAGAYAQTYCEEHLNKKTVIHTLSAEEWKG